uniref:Uncharacterized protein n=1 Tax=Sphenodon punctatus TaxID=8508 RepID=A0A8D0GYQ3_SPHPU
VKDLDGLEVIGKGQPFISVSAQGFQPGEQDEEFPTEEGECQDPLGDYPDVVPEPVLGPSVMFCGQPARWIDSTTSHRVKMGVF